MLLRFNFKNFKSFRDDTTIDLTAAKIQEFNDHVVPIGNEKVLPVAAIFGANASGKSNVVEAFNYMAEYVAFSLNYGEENIQNGRRVRYNKPAPFLFDDATKNDISYFEVFFIDSEKDGAKTYQYGFTVSSVGVQEEWLNYRSRTSRGDFKRIFYRCAGKELSLSGIPEKYRENITVSLNKETLVVSLGAKLRIDKLKKIRDWFLANEFADFGHPIKNLFLSSNIPEGFTEDENVRKRVIRYISTFDPSIIDFKVEVIKTHDEDDESHIKIDAVHKLVNSNKTAAIPLENESAGTLKMFALYPMLENVMKSGGVYFVDELNAKLHPLLVKAFITAFLDPQLNVNHAQLIFTTHDTWQLDSGILRRDEIWFTEKNSNGISTLFSLYGVLDENGVQIRKDENFEINYLRGKYGAVPKLNMLNFF